MRTNYKFHSIAVRLGEHEIGTNPDCRQLGRKRICNPDFEEFGVEKIITHPKYNERKRVNDIALIKLDRDVEFKSMNAIYKLNNIFIIIKKIFIIGHIKPVCLPITKQSYEITTNTFTIAGWGATENSKLYFIY